MWFILGLATLETIKLFAVSILAHKLLPLAIVLGIRFLVSGFLLLSYQYFLNYSNFKINPALLKDYLLVSVFGFIIPQVVCGFITYRMPNAETSLLNSLEPITIILIMILFYQAKVSRKQIIGLIICSITMLAITAWEAQIERAAMFSNGGMLTILMTVSTGYAWIVISELARKQESPIMITGIGALACGAASLIAFFMIPTPDHTRMIWDQETFLLIALLIICGELLLHRLRTSLSEKFTPAFLSCMNFFTPFILVSSEVAVFHRLISPGFFTLIIPALFFTYIFYQEELRLAQEIKN